MTQPHQTLLGIIGHNINYTLSPAMYNEAIQVLHLPYTYGVFDLAREFLPGLITALRTEHVRGANVTIPHKQAVLPLMDTLSREASALGAVNTIINNDGVLTGENTDVEGVRASLRPHQSRICGGAVVVLGAGGASRAVLYAAAELRPQTIKVFNRDEERARQVIAAFQELFPDVNFAPITPGGLTRAIEDAGIVINTTSVGMKPDIAAMPIPEIVRFSNQQIIFDIIYIPLQTALLRKAASDGAIIINGLEMFVQQGASAFTLWTGLPFPADEARERVRRELGKR
jgi:shikimate dehydrogenase